jgi:hypothetical protein
MTTKLLLHFLDEVFLIPLDRGFEICYSKDEDKEYYLVSILVNMRDLSEKLDVYPLFEFHVADIDKLDVIIANLFTAFKTQLTELDVLDDREILFFLKDKQTILRYKDIDINLNKQYYKHEDLRVRW